MCLLICIRRSDGSLAVAANRDERHDRPTRAPFVWATRPRVLAGRDELAGGTWLAVNECGVVAAVTNRPTVDGDDPTRPTRGELPLLACRSESAAAARDLLAEHLTEVRHNGFNLLVCDAAGAFVALAPGGEATLQDIRPGVHVVANGGWNDLADPRVARARRLLAECRIVAEAGEEELVSGLMRICRDHEAEPCAQTLCMHGAQSGTVSSTILTLRPDRRLGQYLHAPGPPCRSEYSDLGDKLRPPCT